MATKQAKTFEDVPRKLSADDPVAPSLQKGSMEAPELGRRRNLFKNAFGYKAKPDYDPLATEFAKSVMARMKDRWAHDRSAAQDQLGGTVYSKTRTAELEDASGNNYLARQYGLRTAKNRTSLDDQPGLRVDNPNSAVYNRDFPSGQLDKQCRQICGEVIGTPLPQHLVFANSEAAVERYKFLVPDNKVAKTYKLCHGLVAIELSERDDKVADWMKHIGGMPSGAEVMKQADPKQGKVTLAAEPLGSAKKLADIAAAGNPAVKALQGVPDGHALKEVARSAASMLAGLQQAFDGKTGADEFEKNPLIDSSLKALGAIVKALPTMLADSTRFFSAYEAMLDEVYILLAAARPYGENACKDAAAASLKRRAPVLGDYTEDVQVESYLVSSGMDALTTGWQAAAQLAGKTSATSLAQRGDKDPDYFEVGEIVKSSGLGGEGGVITATLNPSLPRTTADDKQTDAWDPDVLIKTVADKLNEGNNLVLLLDVTVEKESGKNGESELNRVLQAFKPPVEAGQLKVVLAKSYQKYPSLGSGKVMAGAVSIIAKSDDATLKAVESLGKAETDLDWMANDDSQLLAHFLTKGADSEVPMISKAAESAKFAQAFCAGQKGFAAHGDGLPFLVVVDEVPEVKCKKRKDKPVMSVGDWINKSGADLKDSFAFLNTSYLGGVPTADGAGCRITVGQESKEEVIEKLWAVGTIVAPLGFKGTLGPGEIVDKAGGVVGAACDDVADKASLAAWAESAIRIVERAGGDAKALKADWERCQQGAKAEDEMRRALKAALKASHATSKNPLKDQLDVISAAFPAKMSDEARAGNDVSAMEQSAQRTWQGEREPDDSTRYAPSIVASCLNLMAAAFGPEDADDDDLAKIEQIYEAAIGSGLEGVSPAARTKIIQGWARLQKRKLEDPAARPEALSKLTDNARKLPYAEDKAKLLRDAVPDTVLDFADAANREKIVKPLFGPLDADMKSAFIIDLWQKGDFEKAKACITSFRRELDAAREGAAEIVSPERLGGGADDSRATPKPMPEAEIDMRLDELARIEQELDRSILAKIKARIAELMRAMPTATRENFAGFPMEVQGYSPVIRRLPKDSGEQLKPLLTALVDAFHRRQLELSRG